MAFLARAGSRSAMAWKIFRCAFTDCCMRCSVWNMVCRHGAIHSFVSFTSFRSMGLWANLAIARWN